MSIHALIETMVTLVLNFSWAGKCSDGTTSNDMATRFYSFGSEIVAFAGVGTNPYSGSMDQISMWSAPLSDSEIK